MLAVAAERLGELVVAARGEARRDLAFVAVDPDLGDADLAPSGVISDHEDGREAEAGQRLELETVQAEGAVARDDDDLLRGLGGLHAERVGRADAEAAEWSGV